MPKYAASSSSSSKVSGVIHLNIDSPTGPRSYKPLQPLRTGSATLASVAAAKAGADITITSYCKLIHRDSYGFTRSPVVCIWYDDQNEGLKQLCEQALEEAIWIGLKLKSCLTIATQIDPTTLKDVDRWGNAASGGHWVAAEEWHKWVTGEFGAVAFAANKWQFERAWALAALIAIASFTPQCEPTLFSMKEGGNAEFNHIVQKINFARPPPPDDTPPGSPATSEAGVIVHDTARPPPPPDDTPTSEAGVIVRDTAAAAPPPPPDDPPPVGWRKVWNKEHDCFYFWNTYTNRTSWDDPRGGIVHDTVRPPPPPDYPPPADVVWRRVWSEEHQDRYFWNVHTNLTTWEEPRDRFLADLVCTSGQGVS